MDLRHRHMQLLCCASIVQVACVLVQLQHKVAAIFSSIKFSRQEFLDSKADALRVDLAYLKLYDGLLESWTCHSPVPRLLAPRP